MREVLVSRPLPLADDDPIWLELNRLAQVRVCPLDSTLSRVEGVVSLLSDPIDRAFFERAPNLKVVANYAVGYDNIDVGEATRRFVLVCNTPDVLTNATAELTIGLIFAAARRFKEGGELIRARKFKGWDPFLLLGRELAGARLGVIGPGRIGSLVATKARALGMDVVTHGRKAATENLERLLSTSDFVSLHCPLTPESRDLLNAKRFELMKKGAFLVNTARGELVDEDALLNALKSDHLGGAALDVFRGEPKLQAALRTHPRILVLPHLGSATLEARGKMARLAVQAVVDVLSGRLPKNRVN